MVESVGTVVVEMAEMVDIIGLGYMVELDGSHINYTNAADEL